MKALEIIEEPRWITEPILLAIHAQQIERYGGTHGVLARPMHRRAYDADADLADLAAAYYVGFARSQGFADGNKRTGLACALVFLAINDRPLHVPGQELYSITMGIANGNGDDEAIAAYIRQHLLGTS